MFRVPHAEKQLGEADSTRVTSLFCKHLFVTVVVDKTFQPHVPTGELLLHFP
jgi:hypothetical protein